MDFFEAQDAARTNTAKLIIFFVLAVLVMIVLTNLLVMVTLGLVDSQHLANRQMDWTIFAAVGLVIVVLVAMGSFYKIAMLSGGGVGIAEQLNGKLVVDGSGDADKQRLLNVVEEMAIASGVPVPPVYLLDENAINAFAAGHHPGDAVIGITSGAVKTLTREELQGVIAHEFSHILNGDMRMNIRLIGVLHGILLIGLSGYYLMRYGPRSRNSKGGGGIVLLGLGMVVIGYAGTFFGHLIKAAVNRQREFLADGSAVQFTRNPEGIGGALIQIGALKNGGVLTTPKSTEISHALFCQGFSTSFASLFATHPPLEDRIRRIIPSWDDSFRRRQQAKPQPIGTSTQKKDKPRLGKGELGVLAAGAAVLNGDAFEAHVGRPNDQHLAYARKLIGRLPEMLKKAVHAPFGARAVIYCLVLDKKEAIREKQLGFLRSAADSRVYIEVQRLIDAVAGVEKAYRLSLIELALATLRQLSPPQYQLFKKNLMGLIAADNRISLFEWTLQKIVLHHLDGVYEKRKGAQRREVGIKRTREACTILLSLLANALKQEGITRQSAYEAAHKELPWFDMQRLEQNTFTLNDLNSALDDLASLKPRHKAMLLKGCVSIVNADNHISSEETELLRAIASGLDCPIPPILVSKNL